MAYNNKCVITGINDEYALEAAHIESYINEKSNHIKNGICLRADIHKLFDKNLIGINGDFKIFIRLDMVPRAGLEPARTYEVQWILSPSCLPIPPSRQWVR